MARRRKLPRAKPGQGTILKKQKRQRRKKRDVRNSFSSTFEVINELGYDLSAIKLVEHVAIRLAEHHRDSLLKGLSPGGGRLPSLSENSTDGTFGPRKGNTFFNNTGKSAKIWWIGPSRGTNVSARRILKPTIAATSEGQFDFMINKWLSKGIDLQSVLGPAQKVIASAVDEYMDAAIGSKLGTPKKLNKAGMHLNRAKVRVKQRFKRRS